MSDMDNRERAQAQKEAVEAASKASRSADRARLWAGLNRYLASEAEHAQRAAREEREKREQQEKGRADKAGHHKV